jgi:NAD(P)-dependent dehydrogenase (short-subunit alcohol dehydrogenase family)
LVLLAASFFGDLEAEVDETPSLLAESTRQAAATTSGRTMMDLGLKGAAAVVTGGSKGMGRATALCLAQDGARICVLARGREALDDAVTALRGAGSPDAFGQSVDLGNAEAIAGAFETIGKRWGELNCLINTIGPHAGHFFELTDEDFFAHFNIGAMSAVRCIRAALPLLRKAEWARIVNVSAHSTKRQAPGLVSYTAAKSALTSISKNLARTLAPENILVNTVSPGTFLSAAFTENLRPVLEPLGIDPEDPYAINKWIAENYGSPADLARAGRVEEIGPVIAFLASRRNSYMTGANVNVDGGSDFS